MDFLRYFSYRLSVPSGTGIKGLIVAAPAAKEASDTILHILPDGRSSNAEPPATASRDPQSARGMVAGPAANLAPMVSAAVLSQSFHDDALPAPIASQSLQVSGFASVVAQGSHATSPTPAVGPRALPTRQHQEHTTIYPSDQSPPGAMPLDRIRTDPIDSTPNPTESHRAVLGVESAAQRLGHDAKTSAGVQVDVCSLRF